MAAGTTHRTQGALTWTAIFGLLLAAVVALAGCTPHDAARPSSAGQLRVEGTQLVGQDGSPVVLHGVSTHGLTWFPEYVNEDLFRDLAIDWDCNLVRLAMYSDIYCAEGREESLAVLRRGIDAAVAADMYVIVDWHILEDGNPNEHLTEALEFFELISAEYAGVPNVIYEICNEPNGDTTWEDIRTYAEQVIPAIRANSPESIAIVGTPDYDRLTDVAAGHPLEFPNVMYSMHFYAASHGDELRDELVRALEDGLPVFVSECGLSEETGDGELGFESATEWFTLLRERNVSYAVWSLCNKAESSALIRSDSPDTTDLDEYDLSQAGLWVRALISGQDPASIPAADVAGTADDVLPGWLPPVGPRGTASVASWWKLALAAFALVAASVATGAAFKRSPAVRGTTYDDLVKSDVPRSFGVLASQAAILASTLFTLVYLAWRVTFSIPLREGWLAIACNVVLLVVEAFGFVESLVHYESMAGLREHPLPHIADEDFPEVDVFIATYNEPPELLERTLNGCVHLRYPDKSKVHVWLCDDNRRPEMRALAERMGVGYFDRPDNKGAKAGNLNAALARTSAPYVVTLDADMIPKSDFLLKTIPYFVDAERHAAELPEDKRVRLGFIQTPQCFYQPDIFQYALYSETRSPNEQDYFYRTIEPAKTSTNSVIYGGSNTVLARAALEAVGGFYTESITEDFATGMLIESAGFVSLGLPEPLASGQTPQTFREHIQQRVRWGRGVIVTARKLRLMRRPGLTLAQRMSYWSSVVYWYSPIKNLVYLVSPLLFAVFGLPVFSCTWLDLVVYWLPMFLAQEICLRVMSGNAVSTKWSGIHETSAMAHLLIPICKEALGITLSTFKVTDKSGNRARRTRDLRAMAPFAVLAVLSLVGIVRVALLVAATGAVGLFVELFWLVRNLYFLVMALFLVDGRDADDENVRVRDAELVMLARHEGEDTSEFFGVATLLTEHSMLLYLDEAEDLSIGDRGTITVESGLWSAELQCVVTGRREPRMGGATVHTVEIIDFGSSRNEYLQILYDRIPTLPQSLNRDLGIIRHMWRNAAFRAAQSAE